MKKLTRRTSLAAVSLLLPLSILAAESENATEIVRKSDEQMRGDSSYCEMTMRIIRPNWTRSMSMKAWTKDTEYSLILVTDPARDKGSSSLKRGKEMWNWVPNIERIIKIAPSMLSQSWMGSDFTNDDLINQSSMVVDYAHSILHEELFDDAMCWVIEAIPKPNAPVVWSRLVLWIAQDDYNLRKGEYYDEFDELINTMSSYDVKELGSRKIATRLVMKPADKPDQRTVIIYHQAAFDFDLKTEFFSLNNMKAIRE